MNSNLSRWLTPLGVGFVAGAGMAYVDNVAFAGEVSPLVIVALLLGTTFTAGAVWGRRGWAAAVVLWAWLPLVHVVKHVLGLPDTLHPNTYTSILYFAGFTLFVVTAGTCLGAFARRLVTSPAPHEDRAA